MPKCRREGRAPSSKAHTHAHSHHFRTSDADSGPVIGAQQDWLYRERQSAKSEFRSVCAVALDDSRLSAFD